MAFQLLRLPDDQHVLTEDPTQDALVIHEFTFLPDDEEMLRRDPDLLEHVRRFAVELLTGQSPSDAEAYCEKNRIHGARADLILAAEMSVGLEAVAKEGP